MQLITVQQVQMDFNVSTGHQQVFLSAFFIKTNSLQAASFNKAACGSFPLLNLKFLSPWQIVSNI